MQSISRGEEWSDAFYRNIVDKIVVAKGRKADIYLRQMPGKWQGKILAGMKEIENYEKKSTCVCSIPISVSRPFNSGRGIE